MAYRKEVDKVLKDNGGDSLDNWYWTCAEYSTCHSFSYSGKYDKLYYSTKNSTFGVRSVKDLK